MRNAAHKLKMEEEKFPVRLQTMSELVRNPWMPSDRAETQRALARGLSRPPGCRVRELQAFISWRLQVCTRLT